MHSLTLLDLSRTPIKNLPISISNLKSLSALLLSRCINLVKLCPLSDLGTLKRLDLSYSGIIELPEGMNLLTNLRDLSLDEANSLLKIPKGILPKLTHLQRLALPTYGGQAKVRGEEIASLQNLESFGGNFYNINDTDRCLSSWGESSPNNYLLLMGEAYMFHRGEDLEMDKAVHVGECDDFVMLCQLKSLKKATDLRTCIVNTCRRMKHVFCSTCCNLPFIQQLEYLKLGYLWNLTELVCTGSSCESVAAAAAVVPGLLPTGTFSSLKVFSIEKCHNIKKLFTSTLLSHLQNLERVHVIHCDLLEEIVQVLDEDQDEDQEVTSSSTFSILPKLKELKLRFLPELKSFCSSRKLVSDSLEKIFIERCPILERFPLLRADSHPSTLLKCITVDKEWWESIEFDNPNTKDILNPICHLR